MDSCVIDACEGVARGPDEMRGASFDSTTELALVDSRQASIRGQSMRAQRSDSIPDRGYPRRSEAGHGRRRNDCR
jgi:hypothetical protein